MPQQGPTHQALCAVCVKPITKDQEFVISATEVFHLVCVKAHGTQKSLGNRRRAKLAEERAKNAEVTQQVEFLRTRIDELNRYQRDHDRMITAEREVARLTLELAQIGARDVDYRRQRDAMRVERDAANAALAAANREILLVRTMIGDTVNRTAPLPTQTQTQADPAAQDDGKDATEKRFSLLELD